MARVVETEEPTTVVERETVPQHVHDDVPRRSGAGLVLAIIAIIIILALLFWWRPWGGTSTGSGGTNINVTPPTTSTGR